MDTKLCKYCGATLSIEAYKCFQCKAEQAEQPINFDGLKINKGMPEKMSKSTNLLHVFAVLNLILGIIGGIYVFVEMGFVDIGKYTTNYIVNPGGIILSIGIAYSSIVSYVVLSTLATILEKVQNIK